MAQINVAFSLLCVLCGITFSFAFVFEDCGSEIGKMTSVSISTCDVADEKCSFPREKKIDVAVKFIPSIDVTDVKAYAFGVLMDVPIPFPLEKPDVCKDPNSGLKCPLKKDQEVEYKNSYVLEKKTPTLSIDVIWEFRNDKDQKIMCIKFPARVV
ncbi:NPC intracellular cholesterol transporter 2 homolog a [Monomorium pharaonis]|uniref:NPC intracellular cholesterol transporter 2 homolog a n=1 Tax=Monomorium pharaonis TaxID=307658 RepID=UPI00063F7760|nr:NPC intracellular cholesterol transporter 2 homolog a [Monomorium pharaonis]